MNRVRVESHLIGFSPCCRVHLAYVVVAFYVLTISSCIIHGDCMSLLFVRGTLLEETTGAPIARAPVGGRAFASDKELDFTVPVTTFGGPNGPPSGEDGSFLLAFSTPLMGCPSAPFPRPDQVEIIVVRDGCESSFLIDINEDTVVDLSFPDDVIELKGPILVPPCEE